MKSRNKGLIIFGDIMEQLDVLPNGNSLHEVAHIANGSHPGNCISLFRINVSSFYYSFHFN